MILQLRVIFLHDHALLCSEIQDSEDISRNTPVTDTYEETCNTDYWHNHMSLKHVISGSCLTSHMPYTTFTVIKRRLC